jgi:hypothetical protein
MTPARAGVVGALSLCAAMLGAGGARAGAVLCSLLVFALAAGEGLSHCFGRLYRE